MSADDFRPRRWFTLEEANRALPLVSRIISDVMRAHGEMASLEARSDALESEGRQAQAEELRDQCFELNAQIDDFTAELASVGCICKDPGAGLVDFPARVGGRAVFLCWQHGERKVHYWHELEAGFAGRRPVDGVFS